MTAPFKTCPNCGAVWPSRRELIEDPNVVLTGYQVHFKPEQPGHFCFIHSCRGSFGIDAGAFADLVTGELFAPPPTDSAFLQRRCLCRPRAKPCPPRCECAAVAAITTIVKSGKTR
jgi:hypothetical protein